MIHPMVIKALWVVLIILAGIGYYYNDMTTKKIRPLKGDMVKLKQEYEQNKSVYDNLSVFFSDSIYSNKIIENYEFESIFENLTAAQDKIKSSVQQHNIVLTMFKMSLNGSETNQNATDLVVDNIGFKQEKLGLKSIKIIISGKYYSYPLFKEWIKNIPNSFTSIEKIAINDNTFNIILNVYGK
jgi:galactitol-specific phosphotransferase system IIB component